MTLTYDIANWMSLVSDSKLVSELSIPGTHDSAAMKREGFDNDRLTTQSRTVREQLEDGVRFLDLRVGFVDNEFGLYHESTSLKLAFTAVRDVCKQFLDDHPRETIIASVKNEYEGRGNKVTFQKRFEEYVAETPGLWFLGNFDPIPRLLQVRKKIVLFRRFDVDRKGTSLGINAFDNFPNNETKSFAGPPKLYIQDEFGLKRVPPTETLLMYKWQAVKKLLDDGPTAASDVLIVNFTSAAGYFNSNRYPKPVAEYLNPRTAQYFKEHDQGRFGIIPRDYEGSFADVSVNRLIAHTNVPYDRPNFYLVSKANGQVVDVEGSGTRNGTPIIAFPKNAPVSGNQLWEFSVSDTPPDFRIGPRHAAVTMDIANTNPMPGARVVANTRTSPDNKRQLWTLVPSDETNQYFFIVNNLNGGVITLDGLREPQRPEKGADLATTPRRTPNDDNQLWSFVKFSPA